MYLDRSRAMYLRNVKLAKKIGEIKKILDEDPVRIPNQQTPENAIIVENWMKYIFHFEIDYNRKHNNYLFIVTN